MKDDARGSELLIARRGFSSASAPTRTSITRFDTCLSVPISIYRTYSGQTHFLALFATVNFPMLPDDLEYEGRLFRFHLWKQRRPEAAFVVPKKWCPFLPYPSLVEDSVSKEKALSAS